MNMRAGETASIHTREQYEALQARTVTEILAENYPEAAELSFDPTDRVLADIPKIDGTFLELAEMVRRPEAAKDRIRDLPSADLAIDHDGICALLSALDDIPSPIGGTLIPHLERLRDQHVICGLRRGAILATGNDSLVDYWAHLTAAVLLSMTLLSGVSRNEPPDAGTV